MMSKIEVSPLAARALYHFALETSGLFTVEVALDGVIRAASVSFRKRHASFRRLDGRSIWDLLQPEDGELDDLEALLPDVPVPAVMRTVGGKYPTLYFLYRTEDGVLFLGEDLGDMQSGIIERMSQLSSTLARVVRDARQSYRELAAANTRNEHLANHDSLTALANRRYFMHRFAVAFEHARSRDKPLALLYLDLDGFKAINDEHGHAAGDAVLVAVADQIRSTLRLGDIAARTGGEEFVVLLADADLDAAVRAAERLGESLRSLRHLEQGLVVTTSIGAAAHHEADSADELLLLCDRRLYAAKRAGRDRVVAADTEPASHPQP